MEILESIFRGGGFCVIMILVAIIGMLYVVAMATCFIAVVCVGFHLFALLFQLNEYLSLKNESLKRLLKRDDEKDHQVTELSLVLCE